MKDLDEFESEYDSSHEDAALAARGRFIRAYPRESLSSLALRQYVVGYGTPTFCNLVESGTKSWANIQGATAFKFGVYFGRTKSDETQKYRFTTRFGPTAQRAFRAVRKALVDLIGLGAAAPPDFVAIDANPLSQMFKAKVLSLYYPEKFAAVCSAEDLEMLGEMLGLKDNLPASEYQSLLLGEKRRNAVTRRWSAPKFMAYLYKVYVRSERVVVSSVQKPRQRKHRRVDFDEMQKQREELGRRAEEFALRWEKERLAGAGLSHLIVRIEDRRDRPGYGHDFLSWSEGDAPRYIEVKSVAKVRDGHRFFLSDTEYETSRTAEYQSGYYFYLVFFDSHRKPLELEAVLARRVYTHAEMLASAYEVRFDRLSIRA